MWGNVQTKAWPLPFFQLSLCAFCPRGLTSKDLQVTGPIGTCFPIYLILLVAGGMAALGLFEGFEAKLWRGRGHWAPSFAAFHERNAHNLDFVWGLHWCQLGPSWQFPRVGPGPYCKYLGRRDALCAQDQPVIVHIFLEDHVIQDSWKHAQCLAVILPALAFMYYFICACPQLRTGFVWK